MIYLYNDAVWCDAVEKYLNCLAFVKNKLKKIFLVKQ